MVIQKCIETVWLWSCVGHLGNPTVHNFGSFSTTPESATCRSWFLLQDWCPNTCRSHSWMCLERYTIKSAPTTDFLSHHAFKSFQSWTPEVSPPPLGEKSLMSILADWSHFQHPSSHGKKQTFCFQTKQLRLPSTTMLNNTMHSTWHVLSKLCKPWLQRTDPKQNEQKSHQSAGQLWNPIKTHWLGVSLIFLQFQESTLKNTPTSVTAVTVAERGAWCSRARSPKKSP